jgi:tight adherence protein C
MSSLYLPLALVATFCAVALGGIAVEFTLAERRRAIRLLEAQVGQVGVNLRHEDLSRSFFERVLFPVGQTLGKIARRVTPIDMHKRIAHRLLLAGTPAGWDEEKVASVKVLGLVGGVVFGFAVTWLGGSSPAAVAVTAAFFGAAGFVGPDAVLERAARRRQDEIQKALPDTMDLLTISVEAGLGFDAALAQVINNVPGPLSREIGRMLHEVQLGVSRVDAFRNLADRTDVDELRAFVLAMIQADVFGVGVASVLRAQAKDLRTKRRQRAERKAMQTPVKILFPLIFCVLPALFVVILGPGAIRIYSTFFGATGP